MVYSGRNRSGTLTGGLFDGGDALALDQDGLTILHRVAQLDWSSIEPSILGTLFQRSLDPSKRSQLGAHYTSKEDILLIIEPVLMAPLRREWEAVKVKATELADRRDKAGNQSVRTRLNNELGQMIGAFLERLSTIRVLDPACGSGNFLYMALRTLLDLWKEVSNFAGTLSLPLMLTTSAPSPEQLFGIELDAYAHELAQATVWIGYIQWLHENGYGIPSEPILRKLDNIKHMDAILAYDAAGKPVEPEWPVADVIIGNPPFLGGQKLRRELGDELAGRLFQLYQDRVPASADLVCYWFDKVGRLIEQGKISRSGLISTQSIRAGSSRQVLSKIKQIGNIFMAWSDRPWILDGASVRVSMIGCDDGREQSIMLDGHLVNEINSDLTSTIDLTKSMPLGENRQICYRCDEKGGAFDIDSVLAQKMLSAPINPNGHPNSDVVRPYINALDITNRSRNVWIVDFGCDMSIEDASLFELPFQHVQQWVKPERAKVRSEREKSIWWIHRRPAPDMRNAVKSLSRFIVTPRVAKHRLFVFLPSSALPDSRVAAFARQDDYFFGVLHSSIHEIWSLATSSRHGVGNDPTYNNTTCFETFPFPWPPGSEPTDDPIVQAIAQAAKELVEKRDNWLNPAGATEAQLKKLTLTNLYNARPTWLDLVHKKLDQAVLAAYGWSDLMTDDGINEDEVLARLLALNLERAAKQGEVQPALIDEGEDEE